MHPGQPGGRHTNSRKKSIVLQLTPFASERTWSEITANQWRGLWQQPANASIECRHLMSFTFRGKHWAVQSPAKIRKMNGGRSWRGSMRFDDQKFTLHRCKNSISRATGAGLQFQKVCGHVVRDSTNLVTPWRGRGSRPITQYKAATTSKRNKPFVWFCFAEFSS